MSRVNATSMDSPGPAFEQVPLLQLKASHFLAMSSEKQLDAFQELQQRCRDKDHALQRAQDQISHLTERSKDNIARAKAEPRTSYAPRSSTSLVAQPVPPQAQIQAPVMSGSQTYVPTMDTALSESARNGLGWYRASKEGTTAKTMYMVQEIETGEYIPFPDADKMKSTLRNLVLAHLDAAGVKFRETSFSKWRGENMTAFHQAIMIIRNACNNPQWQSIIDSQNDWKAIHQIDMWCKNARDNYLQRGKRGLNGDGDVADSSSAARPRKKGESTR